MPHPQPSALLRFGERSDEQLIGFRADSGKPGRPRPALRLNPCFQR